MTWISSVEAKKMIGCSGTAIHKWCKNGTLNHQWITQGKRKLLKLCQWSVHAFIEANKDNKRIGRELFCRDVKRKPIISKGYKLIWKPDHPLAYNDGYVPEHILVAEKMLKRPLQKGETVHHKNRIRSDNRKSNLVIYSSQSDHMRLAHAENNAKMITEFNRE